MVASFVGEGDLSLLGFGEGLACTLVKGFDVSEEVIGVGGTEGWSVGCECCGS